MKTRLPYNCRIDLKEYLDRYFLKADAVKKLPSDKELKDLAVRSIVKDHIELAQIPEGESAAAGDVAELKTESALSRFNKTSITVTLGSGLYDKKLEEAVIGLKKNESTEVFCHGEAVAVTVLKISRKYVPEPTDEMVKALKQTDTENKPVNTVAEYEAYVKDQKITEALSLVFGGVMEMICRDFPLKEYDEDDIRILGRLEKEWFRSYVLEDEGVDLCALSEDEMMKRWNCRSFDEFISMRRDWYKIKIHQCLIMLNMLKLPCEGRTDPCDHYEVYQELTQETFERIRLIMSREG